MRHSKTSYMRFWPDRPDKTVKVRWFVTNKPFLPYFHSFGSLDYLHDRGAADQGVGEAGDIPRVWNNGSVPFVYPGVAPCGDAAAWLSGVPFPSPAPPPTVGYASPCCLTSACGVTTWSLATALGFGPYMGQSGPLSLVPFGGHFCAWDRGVGLPFNNTAELVADPTDLTFGGVPYVRFFHGVYPGATLGTYRISRQAFSSAIGVPNVFGSSPPCSPLDSSRLTVTVTRIS